jgi:hypothetical protein
MSEDDGRHDFDFVTGVWLMQHRRLVDVFDPAGDQWVEFESVATGDIRLYGSVPPTACWCSRCRRTAGRSRA